MNKNEIKKKYAITKQEIENLNKILDQTSYMDIDIADLSNIVFENAKNLAVINKLLQTHQADKDVCEALLEVQRDITQLNGRILNVLHSKDKSNGTDNIDRMQKEFDNMVHNGEYHRESVATEIAKKVKSAITDYVRTLDNPTQDRSGSEIFAGMDR